jgi:hypothetical protein
MKVAPVFLLLVFYGCGQSENRSTPTSETVTAADGHVRLIVEVGGKKGFVDETGKLVINPQWDVAYPFNEGLAIVCVGECDSDHFIGYRLGKNFEQIALEQTHKFGFVDETGKLAINPMFEEAGNFSEGLAAVCLGKGCYYSLKKDKPRKWGYIDKNGAMIIPPQFDDANEFKEGLASVSVGGKWGYIDRNGKFLINPRYDFAFSFENGFARVGLKISGKENESKSKFGYINKAGKYIWEPSD